MRVARTSVREIACPRRFFDENICFRRSFPVVSSYLHRREECIMRVLGVATFIVCTLAEGA